jgi:mannose-6-phosphate isomerase
VVVSADDSPPLGLLNLDLTSAVALSPKNFTHLNRTPWAGQALARGIKRLHASSSEQKIGESWELSCDPEAPSKLVDLPEATLTDLIACRTSECLSGSLVATGRTTCDILVKLINPASPLSLQIHPDDGHRFLRPNECGKPESWLVLSAEEGAGLYLGFRQPLPPEELKRRLETNTFTSDLLQFTPVKPGDYFEIEPHVPHAIGAGVVLLEPQRVLAGKSGKTWRMWDWNRKYDSLGREDAVAGRHRELHIAEATSLLNPEQQSGPQFVERLKRSPTIIEPSPGVTAKIYPPNPWYQVILLDLATKSSVKIKSKACFAGCFMLEGSLTSQSQYGRRRTMQIGENYFIPAAALPNTLTTSTDAARVALVIPCGEGLSREHDRIFN